MIGVLSRGASVTAGRTSTNVLPAAMPGHETLTLRLAAAWDRYWFGPIAAIRPYLLMKVMWGLLAFDVWMERVPLAGRYGAGGFGVAHFRWLDSVQPLPTPELYVGLMLAIGLLAVVCVLTDAPRWMRALMALLYTYGWAMSLHDGYQHHYFISLVLATFVFFPDLRGCDLFVDSSAASRQAAEDQTARAGHSNRHRVGVLAARGDRRHRLCLHGRDQVGPGVVGRRSDGTPRAPLVRADGRRPG